MRIPSQLRSPLACLPSVPMSFLRQPVLLLSPASNDVSIDGRGVRVTIGRGEDSLYACIEVNDKRPLSQTVPESVAVVEAIARYVSW